MGPAGPQGDVGPAGPEGPEGPEGPTGAAGDVAGPASAVDGNLPIFDDTTGKLLADSGVSLASLVAGAAGEWITPPFNAADYNAAGSMTWTITEAQVNRFRYLVVGKVMHIDFNLGPFTLSGTPAVSISRVVPGGYSTLGAAVTLIRANPGATGFQVGFASVNGTRLLFYITPTATTNWTVSNSVWIQGTMTIELP